MSMPLISYSLTSVIVIINCRLTFQDDKLDFEVVPDNFDPSDIPVSNGYYSLHKFRSYYN